MNLIEYQICLSILTKDLDNQEACEDKLVLKIQKSNPNFKKKKKKLNEKQLLSASEKTKKL